MCRLWLSLLVIVAVSAAVVAESHWETYTYNTYASSVSCYWSYYYYCYNWWYYPYYYGYYYYGYYWYYGYWNWCYPRSYYNCYNYYYLTTATGQRCQTGWTGSNCDIAICSPACTGGQSCVNPNTCQCTTSGSKCDKLPCSVVNNCYPGTCDTTVTPKSCKCPSGFSGSNCATISYVPLINSCAAKIQGMLPGSSVEQVLASSTECTAPGVSRKTIWIASSSVTAVDVSWLAVYQNPVALPDGDSAPYIANAPVSLGVGQSTFTVGFQTGYTGPAKSCPDAFVAETNMHSSADCRDTIQQWTDLGGASTAHGTTFTITVDAGIGGRKKSSTTYTDFPGWGSGFGTQDFISNNSTKLQMTFGFDLKPPVHCLTTANHASNNCTVFPIYMNETVTVNPKIQPTFNAWSDDASGINQFHIDVFSMQPTTSNQLDKISDPVFQADVPDSELSLNKVQFTVSKPGTYAIQLTVYDRANNTAMARKIFTYLGDTSLAVNASAFYIDKADPLTGYNYITTLDPPQNNNPYQFTALWPSVFKSNIDPTWGMIVKPWTIQSNMIDDNYGTTFGLRSTDPLALTGVMSYQFAYVIDKNGGIGVNTPANFTNINDTALEQFGFQIGQNDLQSGDTIVAWVRAYGMSTALYTAKTWAYVDTCKYCINVTDSQMKYHTVDPYTTSLVLQVTSKVGGIRSITCDIYDSTKKVFIKTLTAPVATRDPPSSAQRRKRGSTTKPCLPNDNTCYCVVLGQCYSFTQTVDIDNCDIDRFAGDTLTLTYNITSLSGHTISSTIQIQTTAQDTPCRPTVPIISGGAIAGIVIGCIIGLLILVLLIIILIRIKVQHRPAIPYRIQSMASGVRNRFVGQTSASNVNEIYESKSVYLKNNNEKMVGGKKTNSITEDDLYGPAIDNPAWKISQKDVHLGDVVAEGRFAVVRRAQLTRRNEQTTVAAKTLRSGYKTSDIGLMRLKIQFLAKEVRPHKNIIRFIGAVDDDVSLPPILLMELCDMALKDWLASIKSVNTDVLENMLTFTLNIAHGMEFLHSNRITHRRLAARNVLLKRSPGGLEAKLIGLDPALDDGDDTEGGAGQSTVPIKWLAPETLATLNSHKPTYDERTDVWSFGVTVWEIYSQGQTPYPKQKSGDIRTLIQNGHRLSCPSDCPPDLFENVVSPCWNAAPKKRPRFKAIVSSIEEFRSGSGGGDVYYAAAAAADQQRQGDDEIDMYDDAR